MGKSTRRHCELPDGLDSPLGLLVLTAEDAENAEEFEAEKAFCCLAVARNRGIGCSWA